MRLWSIILPLLLNAPVVAGNFQIQSTFASNSAGISLQPNLGEPFWITVAYEVEQDAMAQLSVSNPWRTLVSPPFESAVGNRLATFGPLVFLHDQPMSVSVQLGDDGSDLLVTPARPGQSIEGFSPRSWQASFGSSLKFFPGQASSVEWLVPKAPSFGFQSVFASQNFLSNLVAGDVFKVAGALEVSSSFSATCASVRSDATALRSVRFTALRKLPANVRPFTKSEKLIETGDRSVKALVASALPRNYSRTMSVFDAAQSLFQATVARIQYVHDPIGLPSASAALRTGTGDCGFFAAAFVAGCRNVGIPARPITGFLVGENAWHVWAEFYVPGHGWVPVDPSFADGIDPNGSLPLYFGVIPELNQRVATAIGFEHRYGKAKIPILQSPFALTDPSKVASAQTWSNLTEIP